MALLENKICDRAVDEIERNNFKVQRMPEKIIMSNRYAPVEIRIGYNQKRELVTSLSGSLPCYGLMLRTKEDSAEARFSYNKAEKSHILSLSSKKPETACLYSVELSRQYSDKFTPLIEEVQISRSPENEINPIIIGHVLSLGFKKDNSDTKLRLYKDDAEIRAILNKIMNKEKSNVIDEYVASISADKILASGIAVEVREKDSKIRLDYNEAEKRHVFSVNASKAFLLEGYLMKFAGYYGHNKEDALCI